MELIKQAIVHFPEIESFKIYGSRAKGNYRPGSDIDLALFGKKVSIETVLKLSVSLDNLDLPYEFDLSIYDRLDNPALRDHIDRVGISVDATP